MDRSNPPWPLVLSKRPGTRPGATRQEHDMTTNPKPTARKRAPRKAKDSDLVYVEGVGTTLPAETPKAKRAAKAPAKHAKAVAVKLVAEDDMAGQAAQTSV